MLHFARQIKIVIECEIFCVFLLLFAVFFVVAVQKIVANLADSVYRFGKFGEFWEFGYWWNKVLAQFNYEFRKVLLIGILLWNFNRMCYFIEFGVAFVYRYHRYTNIYMYISKVGICCYRCYPHCSSSLLTDFRHPEKQWLCRVTMGAILFSIFFAFGVGRMPMKWILFLGKKSDWVFNRISDGKNSRQNSCHLFFNSNLSCRVGVKVKTKIAKTAH